MKLTGETKLLVAVGVFVLLGGGFLFLSNLGGEGSPMAQATATPPPPKMTRVAFDTLVKQARHTRDDPKAKLTIIEFADLQCPLCRVAYNSVSSKVGKTIPANFIFYHMPLVQIHNRAMPAAIATEAAGKQGKFWEMSDALFTSGTPENAKLSAEDIDASAKAIGLNMDRFHKDEADTGIPPLIDSDQKQASNNSIMKTPTFAVIKTEVPNAEPQVIIGAVEMENAVQQLLGKAQAPAGPPALANP